MASEKKEKQFPGLAEVEVKQRETYEPYHVPSNPVDQKAVHERLKQLKPPAWAASAVEAILDSGIAINDADAEDAVDVQKVYAEAFKGTHKWYPNSERGVVIDALVWHSKTRYEHKYLSSTAVALTEFECSNWLSPAGQEALIAYETRSLQARLTKSVMAMRSLWRRLRRFGRRPL
jgi:hypothetical protein